MPQSNLNPNSANLSGLASAVESPVKPAYAPEISPQMATKNLGTKFPYSGGAMAFHNPKAMAVPTHSMTGPAAGIGHTIHAPRTA